MRKMEKKGKKKKKEKFSRSGPPATPLATLSRSFHPPIPAILTQIRCTILFLGYTAMMHPSLPKIHSYDVPSSS